MHLNISDACFDITVNGFRRGKQKCFHPENFESLPEVIKARSCRISLSQPYFIALVLFLWTSTCLAELRKASKNFRCLIWRTQRIDSMSNAFKGCHSSSSCKVIHGLTFRIKACIVLFCTLPRILITLYLLWVGSRWLLATDSFADLILNAIALEFILLVKDLIYISSAPHRIMADLAATKMLPEYESAVDDCTQLIEVCLWLGISSTWVVTYMCLLQQVLPAYNWDVRVLCSSWVEKRYEN